jgi:hypothetical protein
MAAMFNERSGGGLGMVHTTVLQLYMHTNNTEMEKQMASGCGLGRVWYGTTIEWYGMVVPVVPTP